MYVHINTHKLTDICTHKNTYIHTQIYIDTYTDTQIYEYMHTYKHTYIHIHTYKHTNHTCPQSHMHKYT